MDARLIPSRVLGLDEGEAHVIRNAGGVVTEDAIRSLSLSQHMLGTEEIVLIHHTDCGLLKVTDEEFAAKLRGGDRLATRVVAPRPSRTSSRMSATRSRA